MADRTTTGTRNRDVDDYPDCPECETPIPVMKTTNPVEDTFHCVRCGYYWRSDYDE